jgi:hypothetical protein
MPSGPAERKKFTRLLRDNFHVLKITKLTTTRICEAMLQKPNERILQEYSK